MVNVVLKVEYFSQITLFDGPNSTSHYASYLQKLISEVRNHFNNRVFSSYTVRNWYTFELYLSLFFVYRYGLINFIKKWSILIYFHLNSLYISGWNFQQYLIYFFSFNCLINSCLWIGFRFEFRGENALREAYVSYLGDYF